MAQFERPLFLLPCCLVAWGAAQAQYAETIRTGRPGQAIGPYVVGAHVFQVQTGVEFGRSNADEAYDSFNYTEPGAVLRFGLGRTFELNTGWAWRRVDPREEGGTGAMHGLSASSVGFRVNIRDGKGHGPSVGFQFSEKLPIHSEVRSAQVVAPRYLLIAAMPLGRGFSALVNIGGDHDGVNAAPVGIYVANVSYGFAGKWSTFVENYGSFGDGFITNWDTGLAYLANNDLQWDLYGGWANKSGGSHVFIHLGLSFRFRTTARTPPTT
jgi:hypothetical protein